MIKTPLQNSPLLKRVNQEDNFAKKIGSKHLKPIGVLQKNLDSIHKVNTGNNHLLNKKPNNSKLEKTLMSSGTVSTLDGYWKDKYENFLGLKLPEIRIHKGHNAILKTNKYKAKAYVSGHDIYLGKDVKPIDSLEGQMTIAHEIVHVLQQEHLDMSSSGKMIDPSVELEKKAKGIEGIVKFRRGIDESASDLIRKREFLPFNSYIYENLVTNKFSRVSNFIQRKDLFKGNIKANLLDADNSENIFIDASTKYEKYEDVLTKTEFKYLSQEAKKTGMTIEIRKMSKEAKINRESGSLAKPMSIKQKTLNQDDIDYLIPENSELKNHIAKVAIYKTQDIKESDLANKIFEKEIVAKKGESYRDKQKRLENINKKVTKGLSNELREEYLNKLKKKNPKSSDFTLLKQLKKYEFSEQFQKDINIKKAELLKTKNIEKYYKKIRVEEILERKKSRDTAFEKYQIDKEFLEYQKGEKKLQDLKYKEKIKEKLYEKLKDKEKLKSIDDVKDSHFVKSNYMKVASLDLDLYNVDENGLVKSKKSGKTYTSDLDIHSVTRTEGVKDNRWRAFIKQDKESRKQGLLLIKRLIEKADSHVEHFATKQSWYSKVIGDKVFTTKAQEYSDAKTRKDKDGKIKKGAEALIFSEKDIIKVKLKANKAGQKTDLVNNILTKYNITNSGGKHNYSQLKLAQNKMLMKAQKLDEARVYSSPLDSPASLSEESHGSTPPPRKDKSRKAFVSSLTNRAKKYTSVGIKFYDKHKGGGNLKKLQDKYQKTKEFTTKLVTGKLELGDVDDALQVGTNFLESDKLKKFPKFTSNKKFKKFSKKFKSTSKFISKLKKGSDIKKLLSGEASTSDTIGLIKDGTEFASKKFKKFAKFGKASKFLGFIQKIVGVFDSKILSNPLKLAQIAADAIGNFIGSIADKIGGKVIAGIVASATAGIGTLLYPVTSYFGGMLVEGGVGFLYDRYAKSPIVQKIHSFAKDSIDSIENNFPTIGHLINGRYLDFFKGMFSFIKPKAIYNFIDNFMSKNFPIVWKGAKFTGKALKKTGEFIGKKIFDGVQGLKKLGGSIWGGLKSFGSSLWGGTKSLASKGLNYAKQGAKWVGDKAEKAWSGIKSVGGSIWGGLKSFGSSLWGGTKSLASKGLNYAKQGAKWVGSKISKVKDSVIDGVNSAYKFGKSKVSQASSYIVNKTKKISNTISSSAKSAYDFGEKKLKQFGGTVSETWDSISNLFKFAELNRHQNQPVSQHKESLNGSESSESLSSMDNQIDELSMRIYRRLKQEVALEYVRSGKS